jgi:hypothetical protein
MLMGASSATGKAPMPTLAGIRGDVVRLVDWVTGRTPPKPPVPRQQETGAIAHGAASGAVVACSRYYSWG